MTTAVSLRVLTVLAVIAATLAGAYLALVSFRQERDLSVGSIRLSVSPGHRGALDVYVPLVDWGARFESIRLPVRLRADLRTVDRDALQRVADGGAFDVRAARWTSRSTTPTAPTSRARSTRSRPRSAPAASSTRSSTRSSSGSPGWSSTPPSA